MKTIGLTFQQAAAPPQPPKESPKAKTPKKEKTNKK